MRCKKHRDHSKIEINGNLNANNVQASCWQQAVSHIKLQPSKASNCINTELGNGA